MSFIRSCVEDSLPVWTRCLETDFLRGMAEGTLSEDCLKGYIVDDSLYLREYAKVFAYGILHAQTMEEIRTFHALLSFVNESEDASRLAYLRRFGLTDEQIQPLPLRPENQAYVDTMLSAARDGGAPECFMACLPCMLSYAHIFTRLLEAHPEVGTGLFGPLVRDYASEGYVQLCRDWAAFAQTLCGDLSEARKAHCAEIFRACSEHEYAFWQMAARPREDV